jgi:hypothetical protein
MDLVCRTLPINLIVGTASSLLALAIVWLFARRSRRLREYFLEVLGIAELNLAYKNALAHLLKRFLKLRTLNGNLVNTNEADLGASVTKLKRLFVDNFDDITEIVTEFQRLQDRFDHMLRIKTQLTELVSSTARYEDKK